MKKREFHAFAFTRYAAFPGFRPREHQRQFQDPYEILGPLRGSTDDFLRGLPKCGFFLSDERDQDLLFQSVLLLAEECGFQGDAVVQCEAFQRS
jgi:hypothetical protein